jgi:hypothetical protein
MIIELLKQTLKPKGRYELKRIASFVSFHISIIYAFLPVLFNNFKIQEFVFIGFLAYSATAIGLNIWNKKIEK